MPLGGFGGGKAPPPPVTHAMEPTHADTHLHIVSYDWGLIVEVQNIDSDIGSGCLHPGISGYHSEAVAGDGLSVQH